MPTASVDSNAQITAEYHRMVLSERVARGVVASLFANVSHWAELQGPSIGPRYEYGISVRVGPQSLQEPAFTRFSAV